MSGSEDEGAAVPAPAPIPVAPMAGPGDLTIPDAVKDVLKNALIHGGLARGLHECTKALDMRKAVMCFLAKNCEVDQYSRLVEALCKEHKIRLMKVDDKAALGEWAGLCRLGKDGKAKKIVNCNCVVVTDVGHSTPALDFVMKYFESKGFSTEMS
ncbi:Ribosomal protein rps12 [Oopsacas minuta]|uniref:40S ribosomal protein S12 n=1 Tax=Oopsacas minuta TaxID=111878 RepID=A0AAV7JXQ1_9METZ|nr:Ribosomal protein rps12 [Oopsacas minuta]